MPPRGPPPWLVAVTLVSLIPGRVARPELGFVASWREPHSRAQIAQPPPFDALSLASGSPPSATRANPARARASGRPRGRVGSVRMATGGKGQPEASDVVPRRTALVAAAAAAGVSMASVLPARATETAATVAEPIWVPLSSLRTAGGGGKLQTTYGVRFVTCVAGWIPCSSVFSSYDIVMLRIARSRATPALRPPNLLCLPERPRSATRSLIRSRSHAIAPAAGISRASCSTTIRARARTGRPQEPRSLSCRCRGATPAVTRAAVGGRPRARPARAARPPTRRRACSACARSR